jgi:(5-formylfuran-3-yl)methyl phosphate synthase
LGAAVKLLVSVRSAAEAQAALAGGADLIDIKEPTRGSLGRADDEVMRAILDEVAGLVPLSVAMDELTDYEFSTPVIPCSYIKFGLAGCREANWRERLTAWRGNVKAIVVPAAYADSQDAGSPDLGAVADFVIEEDFPVLLIDTFGKTGRSLFDWQSEAALRRLADRLRTYGVELALAGSLTREHVNVVRRVGPAWMAVRGAVCRKGERTLEIDPALVASLKASLLTA